MLYEKELREFSNYIRLKGYSLQTYKNYMGIIRKFVFTIDCHLSEVTKGGVEYYILSFKSQSAQRQVHGCLGNFFKHVLHRPEVVQFIPFATKEEKIPDTYAEEEIALLLQHTRYIKHKLLILIQYDCGLRVSEVANIDLAHVDLFRDVVKIAGAKGKKDRLVHFGKTTRALLEIYLREEKPVRYLFEGQHKDRYSVGSIQKVNNQAKARAGITKKGCTHILRHSFATHLYEGGIGLADIGLRLGHAPGSKATQVYARMSSGILRRQVSPADKLNLNFEEKKISLRMA